MRRPSAAISSALLSTLFVSLSAFAATTPTPSNYDYELASKMLKSMSLPKPMGILATGKLDFDKKNWRVETEQDGTELLTATTKVEARIAALRTREGELEAFTSYRLVAAKKKGEESAESASSFFFEKGKLSAFISCEQGTEKDSIGRICVTATPKLCGSLKSGEGLTPDMLQELDAFEMRGLALVLTLRGHDHQLDNVVKTGNRLGLKTALQTTKGQLLALARQVSKEAEAAKKSAEQPTEKTSTSGTAPIAPTSSARDPAASASDSTTQASVANSGLNKSNGTTSPSGAEPAVSAAKTSDASGSSNTSSASTSNVSGASDVPSASDIAKTNARLAADNAMTRKVLEGSLPRLKQACVDTKFVN